MIQLYPLTIIYLLFVSLMNLLEVYKTELSILLRFKHYLIKNARWRKAFFMTGLVIGALKIFFPMYPGPMFLGDILPALTVMWSSLYFMKIGRAADDHVFTGEDRKDNPWWKRGALMMAVAVIHLIFPNFILL